MKKIYQNPEIKVVKMQVAQMIAASGDPIYGGSTNETSGNLSRENRNTFWDNEE
jgi:hypothetical protein